MFVGCHAVTSAHTLTGREWPRKGTKHDAHTIHFVVKVDGDGEAVVIALEKIAPRPEWVVRISGTVAVAVGVAMFVRSLR